MRMMLSWNAAAERFALLAYGLGRTHTPHRYTRSTSPTPGGRGPMGLGYGAGAKARVRGTWARYWPLEAKARPRCGVPWPAPDASW
jgi:hypothetical protein